MRMRHGVVTGTGTGTVTVSLDGRAVEARTRGGATYTVGQVACLLVQGRTAVVIGVYEAGPGA